MAIKEHGLARVSGGGRVCEWVDVPVKVLGDDFDGTCCKDDVFEMPYVGLGDMV